MKLDSRRNLTSRMAYIAGFIDGEGCIRIKKSNQSGNSYYITLQVTNTDKRPLLTIKDVFGGKVFFQEKKPSNKIVWQYYSATAQAADTLRALLGFLVSKKKQAELAIKFQDTQKDLTANQKLKLYKRMREMKREVIGNIYENPELLEVEG